MKARKDNKVYRIDENSRKRYLDEGFDIYDDDGNIEEYSPQKKIPYGEYAKAAKEIERLQGMVSDLNEENEALKAKVTEFEAAQKEDKKTGAKKAGE